jgi:hypothetical protein
VNEEYPTLIKEIEALSADEAAFGLLLELKGRFRRWQLGVEGI